MKVIVAVMGLAGVAHGEPGMWAIPAVGAGVARLSVEADLGRHHEFEPLSVAPDLAIGLSERWGLVLQHSRAAAAELGAGNGLCVIGPHETLDMTAATCESRESGVGAMALARIAPILIGRGGLIVRDVQSFQLAVAVGAVASPRRGRWWAVVAPTLVSGVTERAAGNLDRLQVPLYLGVSFARCELHVRTGIDGTLQTFGETFAIPLGLGASVELGRISVGVDATLDKAFGPLNATAWRSAAIYVETSVGRS